MGRVDVIISTNAVFKYSILDMKYTMDSFEDAGVLWASYGVYIGFSPASAKLEKSKAYVEIINKGISVLRDSGKLEAIMNKYGLNDWE
jgi:polar amino acid transport system substrate-binding protein